MPLNITLATQFFKKSYIDANCLIERAKNFSKSNYFKNFIDTFKSNINLSFKMRCFLNLKSFYDYVGVYLTSLFGFLSSSNKEQEYTMDTLK